MRPPTPRQLAEAADIARRYAATNELTPEEETHVLQAADLMGMSALAADMHERESWEQPT